jgi:hypothetical protein
MVHQFAPGANCGCVAKVFICHSEPPGRAGDTCICKRGAHAGADEDLPSRSARCSSRLAAQTVSSPRRGSPLPSFAFGRRPEVGKDQRSPLWPFASQRRRAIGVGLGPNGMQVSAAHRTPAQKLVQVPATTEHRGSPRHPQLSLRAVFLAWQPRWGKAEIAHLHPVRAASPAGRDGLRRRCRCRRSTSSQLSAARRVPTQKLEQAPATAERSLAHKAHTCRCEPSFWRGNLAGARPRLPRRSTSSQ